jgi:DNA invertase Pin-like site-specific DNA recombinase
MKAFAYIRVSGKGQIDGDGFERQENSIREYAKNHGIELLKIFWEKGVSGTTEVRPELAKLMVDLEENGHGAKTVIVEKLDRLARDLMVQEAIINDLQKKGFSLISATEGADLLEDNPTRKFIRHVFGAIAEYEKSMIVLKLQAARERKRAREGKCEGRKGYSDLAPDIVKELKKLRRMKAGRKPLSYSKIAERMNQSGFTTLTGKAFTGFIVQKILR